MKTIRVGSAAAVAAAVIALGAGMAGAGDVVVAVDDNYDTPFETDVQLDPLANDNLPMFGTDFTIFYDTPSHGSVDGATDIYSPDAGFTGTDEFDYSVCWNWQQVEIDQPAIASLALIPDNFDTCDGATIFVNVGPPPTTTTEAPTTVAATATLPVTGSNDTTPALLLGFGVLSLGLGLALFGRARARGLHS